MAETPVAIITGAGRRGGIGEAIARRLLLDGYRVVVSDLESPVDGLAPGAVADGSQLAATAADLAELGQVTALGCDVRDEEQVDRLVADTVARFGRLDVLVNNAGLGVGLGPVVDMPLADWQRSLDVMATGVFLCSRAAARVMVDQVTRGRIVSIASQAGKSGMPLLAAYSAAKFAVLGFTQALAHELGPHGITVNAVCPGTVDTPLLELDGGLFDVYSKRFGMAKEDYRRRVTRTIPLGRFATPGDIAATVGFLVSPAAAYITGESVNVTGGQEMH